MSSVPAREVIVQFMWPQDDEGDYLAFRIMSEEEIAEVESLLARAEALDLIRPNWYVGTISLSTDPHEAFMKSLSNDLNFHCRCVPTVDEVHPDCPVHGLPE